MKQWRRDLRSGVVQKDELIQSTSSSSTNRRGKAGQGMEEEEGEKMASIDY